MNRRLKMTLAAALALVATDAALGRTPLMVNEDCWYFNGYRPASERTVEGLQRHIDRFAAGGRVTHLCFCVNGMRTAYPTEVGEPMWRTVLEDGTVIETENAFRRMFEKGIDPFRVWIDRCRERGISPWISMRLNDVHGVTTGNPTSTCAFWRNHPELRCCPDDDPVTSGKGWQAFAFNYAKAEVRDYQFALFKEIADRYDADGYELDTMRFERHFAPGREREDAHFLTEFILRCRAYTRELEARRGHAIRLSARVPTSYQAAEALGFDAEAWAREGAVDLIVVCNFFTCVDYEFDFADWLAKIRAANPATRVLPGAADCFDNEECRLDAAAYCGWADQMQAQGAYGCYLFNTSYLPDADKESICRDGLSAVQVRRTLRRYPRTYHDCVPEGLVTGRRLPCGLDVARTIPVVAGHGATDGERVEVVLGLGNADDPAPDVRLNDVACTQPPVRTANGAKYGPDRKTKTVWRYAFPPSAVRPGENRITIGALPGVETMLYWTELAIAPKTSGGSSARPSADGQRRTDDVLFSTLPEVFNVRLEREPASRRIAVTYDLAYAPAVVTVDFQTNGVSLGTSRFPSVTGDVDTLVQPGTDRLIVWDAASDGAGEPFAGGLTAVVRAWAENAPPDILVVDLGTGVTKYYASTNDVPGEGNVANAVYKTDKMAFRRVPARGVRWRMGSCAGEFGRDVAKETNRWVTLTSDYYLGIYECTQAQFARILPATKCAAFTTQGDMRPCDSVSYQTIRGRNVGVASWPNAENNPVAAHAVDETSFLGALRNRTGGGLLFDLPTEAQWEFACRGGRESALYTGYDVVADNDRRVGEIARYGWNSGKIASGDTVPADCGPSQATAVVGAYPPNAWGLYDMLGNVGERCLDRYGPLPG